MRRNAINTLNMMDESLVKGVIETLHYIYPDSYHNHDIVPSFKEKAMEILYFLKCPYKNTDYWLAYFPEDDQNMVDNEI